MHVPNIVETTLGGDASLQLSIGSRLIAAVKKFGSTGAYFGWI
jgi:hypothetical protein